jgi:CubicO group peptidase (beta-lactamase class C family)
VIGGTCDRGFEPVRAAFAENFAARGETGAAICVAVGGRVVADLWGGCANQAGRETSWGPGTLVNVFSAGKGILALLAARLAGQGRLGLDASVTRYWPEFGAAGKEAVTVRQLLSHQAGLPAVRRRLPPGAMFDWPVMTGRWPRSGRGGSRARRMVTTSTRSGSSSARCCGGSPARPPGEVAFAYVTNQMGARWRNPRNRALIDALYACL